MNPGVRAVIFDCDGTLVDSEPIWLRTLLDEVAALDAGQGGAPLRLAFDDIEGCSMARSLEIVAERRGRPLPDDFLPRLRAAMARRFETDLHEIPVAARTLIGLRVPFALASNGPREKIDLVLRVTGLARWMPPSRVFSALDRGRYKPDPDLFLQAAEALGVPPSACAVVEDSLAGIEAGWRAGMTVYAYRPHAPLPAPWDARTRRLHALADLLDEPWNPPAPR